MAGYCHYITLLHDVQDFPYHMKQGFLSNFNTNGKSHISWVIIVCLSLYLSLYLRSHQPQLQNPYCLFLVFLVLTLYKYAVNP